MDASVRAGGYKEGERKRVILNTQRQREKEREGEREQKDLGLHNRFVFAAIEYKSLYFASIYMYKCVSV